MIENKFCSNETKRFAGLPGYPDETGARREIALAIQCFTSEQQARKFVDEWLAHEVRCPLPATIRKAAFDSKDRENTSWLESKRCPDCSGSGFRMVTLMKRAQPAMASAPYEFAVKCDHSGDHHGQPAENTEPKLLES